MNPVEYTEQVLKYLEHLEYPELISEYEEVDVARSMNSAIRICFLMHVSFRMCAIIIWQATMVNQIIPQAKNMVKH